MVKNLMIVESPAKAKTIEKFLDGDFVVKSCYGHVRDLVKKNKGIDVNNDYQPTYEISKDKTKIIKELKKTAKDVENIWLATDEDREGEAISWHLCEVLNISVKEAKRIVFHEITKTAIQEAVKNPRPIDINLVNAQQARRILDRLVGFELSPILWRKVSSQSTLSAGRVQSVSVKLIVEREREIKAHQLIASFKVTAFFDITDDINSGSVLLKAELSNKFKNEKEAEEFLNKCKEAIFSIKDIKVKPGKKSPAAPFTTSTLQQEASRKLGYSVAKTMIIAQKLYEAGNITYMRTDSVNLSETAIKGAGKEIKLRYGDKYVQSRQYKTKSTGAQEAHEAIRPTYFNVHEVEGDNDGKRLYDLIWKRAIASQMSDAQLEKTTVLIDISTTSEKFTATGEVMLFDGFLKAYKESSDEETREEETTIIPPMQVGQQLNLGEIQAVERFSRAPARYNEATLVRRLEELGIGRPSTYAPTISTIQKRGYTVKESREGKERKYKIIYLRNREIKSEQKTEMAGIEKNKLFPTDIGMLVNDFLSEHFNKVMDYSFTAQIEKKFDEIAHSGKQWVKMIDDFYKPFHSKVEKAQDVKRVSGERELGTDPKTGKPISVRVGKYGAMVQLGKTDDEEKPRFAKLLPHQSIESITLEEALELFKLPRALGLYENEEITASIGRFGPYVKHKDKFYSLGKEGNAFAVKLEEAIEVIELKRKADAEKTIQVFKEDENLKVLNGRYGPYISFNKKNAPVPKDKDPKKLSFEECREIVDNYQPKRRNFRRKAKQ